MFPDLTPLINQLKEYNLNQVRTNQLLEEIRNLLDATSAKK